jgi:hypothetical protein
MSESEPESECEICQHPFDPHAMIATTGNPLDGGVMLCPDPGCMCFATWSAPGSDGRTQVVLPDAEELAAMRAFIQGMHLN